MLQTVRRTDLRVSHAVEIVYGEGQRQGEVAAGTALPPPLQEAAEASRSLKATRPGTWRYLPWPSDRGRSLEPRIHGFMTPRVLYNTP